MHYKDNYLTRYIQLENVERFRELFDGMGMEITTRDRYATVTYKNEHVLNVGDYNMSDPAACGLFWFNGKSKHLTILPSGAVI